MWERCYICGLVGMESSKSPLQPNNFVTLWPWSTFAQPYTPFFHARLLHGAHHSILALLITGQFLSSSVSHRWTWAIDAGLTLTLIDMRADANAIIEILRVAHLTRLGIT
jgi:hypothetical protein